MIPVGIVGLFLKDYIRIVFATVLFISRHHVAGNCGVVDIRLLCWPRVKEDISYQGAFIIGLSQAVAVYPTFRVPVRLLLLDSPC